MGAKTGGPLLQFALETNHAAQRHRVSRRRDHRELRLPIHASKLRSIA
jgi:hypothetical protein